MPLLRWSHVLFMNDMASGRFQFIDLGVVDLILGRNTGIANKTAKWGRGGAVIGRRHERILTDFLQSCNV